MRSSFLVQLSIWGTRIATSVARNTRLRIIAKGDPLRTDTLAYSVERATLEAKALRTAKLARAALLYLTLSIHVEEAERQTTRRGRVLPLELGLLDDVGKR